VAGVESPQTPSTGLIPVCKMAGFGAPAASRTYRETVSLDCDPRSAKIDDAFNEWPRLGSGHKVFGSSPDCRPMTRPALAANDSREETRQSELQILLGALDNAAQAAKIGGHLRRILLDAVNQSNVSLAPAFDPRSTSSVLVNPSGSTLLSNAVAREGTVPAEVQQRAAYVLRILSRRQCAALVSQLCRDPRPLVRMLGDRLRSAD
jgi:hypothetical protein